MLLLRSHKDGCCKAVWVMERMRHRKKAAISFKDYGYKCHTTVNDQNCFPVSLTWNSKCSNGAQANFCISPILNDNLYSQEEGNPIEDDLM